MWAAGVCLFVWVWGCLPFQGDSIPDMFTAIKEKPLTFPAHPECDPNLKDLITKVSTVRHCEHHRQALCAALSNIVCSTVKHCEQHSAVCPGMCAQSAILSVGVGSEHGFHG